MEMSSEQILVDEFDDQQTGPDLTKHIEVVDPQSLRPHPRNYRDHPDDQLDHIIESIEEHGFYRNVVTARDGTILAGHGVVKAVLQMGLSRLPIIRLNVDPDDPRALRVLIGDNEIGRRAEVDDRALTEMLKELNELDPDALLGTGFDEQMVAALAYVTRPASEIRDRSVAEHWVGMPEFTDGPETLKLSLSFRTQEDRRACLQLLNLTVTDESRPTLASWWPPKEREDPSSLKFEG